jgi:hypothetical protein
MSGRLNESLRSKVNIILKKNDKAGKVIFSGPGINAGIEIEGDSDKLIMEI